MKCTCRGAALVLAALTAAHGMRADETPLKYPPTRRGDHVDVYHDTRVPDPYRWLEQDVRKSKEVAAWVERRRVRVSSLTTSRLLRQN